MTAWRWGTYGAAMLLAAAAAGQTVRQSGFDAFRRGTVGNSGANLYVSRSGKVQVVNHWDLNRDGYNDILMSNDHDNFEVVDAMIYWNSLKGFTPMLPDLWREYPLAQTLFGLFDRGQGGYTRLPAFGGGKSLIADLNGDGHPDLVFCNYIHNYPGIRSAYIYWGGPRGFDVRNRTELPTNWAAGVAAADLNGDGFLELVFANQGAESGLENISADTGLDSFVYWGSPHGYDPKSPEKLLTQGARDVAIADLNGDGHPDIAFLNGEREAKNVQVFWGAAGGNYSNGRTQVVAVADPGTIRAADLNGDGIADVVITTSPEAQSAALSERKAVDAGAVVVLFGAKAGLNADRGVRLACDGARDVAIGDFNRDGFADLAVANSRPGSKSVIYWGAEAGFADSRKTELPTLAANGVAAGDFNQDGFPDLVFANSHDDTTYDVPSYIYWGSATGFAPYLRSELQSFGAASVSAADLNGDGRPDVVFINQYSGRYGGQLNSKIFWGNAHSHYSSASMTNLPTVGAYDTTAADFNDDGYPDVFFCNSYTEGSYLYWGSESGPSADRKQVLETGACHASGAADLNRDGYLDLVVSGKLNGKPAGTIFWGSATGFSASRKTVLPLQAKRNALTLVIADFNRDGHLDLSFSDHYFGTLEIFWGSKDGYSPSKTWVREMTGGGLNVADFNGDGLLDFVVPGMFDAKRKSYNVKTKVYLGTKDGTPSAEPVAELDAFGTIECAIADLNRDGHLDLACSNYMSDSTRSLPMFIYWGAEGGTFRNANRTVLPAESSAGIQTLDLNGDGYPELVVHNHLKDGQHVLPAAIYWNGPPGFDRARKTELPAFGPHFSQMIQPGNLYTRKLEEEFISEPLDLGAGKRAKSARWKGEARAGSEFRLAVRCSDSRAGLDSAAWKSVAAGGVINSGARWIQYRAEFRSKDAAVWPVLREVMIETE